MGSAWPHLMVPLNNRSEGVLEAIVYRLQQLLEAAPRSSLQALRNQYHHIEFLNGVQFYEGHDYRSPENHKKNWLWGSRTCPEKRRKNWVWGVQISPDKRR